MAKSTSKDNKKSESLKAQTKGAKVSKIVEKKSSKKDVKKPVKEDKKSKKSKKEESESESSSDSDSEEEETKKEESSSDSDSDSSSSSDSDSDSSDSEVEEKKEEKKDSSDSDSSSSSDSDSDSSDDEEEEEKKETKEKKEESSETGSDSDSSSSDEEDDDEEEEEEEKSSKRKADDEEEVEETETKKQKVEEEPATLFVGRLSWNIDNEWLAREFEHTEGYVSARVMTDRQSGRSKGFGYVDFQSKAAADKALNEMQGKEIDGRPINLDISNSRPQNPQARANDRASKFGDQPSAPSDTLFVGNLSFDANRDQLYEAFGDHGSILSVRVPTHPDTEQPKGFGYVQFSSVEEAQNALNNLQGADIGGRNVRLDFSTPRDSPAPGGRGGFRGGRGGPRGGSRGGSRGGARGGSRGGFSRGGGSDFRGKKTTF